MNDGSSWANAWTDLTNALASAQPNSFVLVAEGTYFPSGASGGAPNRDDSFRLNNGIRLRGGYLGLAGGPGAFVTPGMRDGDIAATILSGDIGVPGDSSDNCRTVVVVENGPSSLAKAQELMGFTIVGGFATDAGPVGPCAGQVSPVTSGGGVYCEVGDIEIIECRFVRNFASQNGGAFYFNGNQANYFGVKECEFLGNAAGRRGGAMRVDNAGTGATAGRPDANGLVTAAWIYSNKFVGNSAGSRDPFGACPQQGGGAVYLGPRGGVAGPGVPVAIANNTANRNVARGRGSVYYISSNVGNPVMICNDTHGANVVVSPDPTNVVPGGVVYYDNSGGTGNTISNSIIYENDDVMVASDIQGPGAGNVAVMHSDVWIPIPGAIWPGNGNLSNPPMYVNLSGGDLRLMSTSTCIDVGSDVFLLPDHADLDRDLNVVEPIPRMITTSIQRILDFGAPGSGICGAGAIVCGLVDMGAFEK